MKRSHDEHELPLSRSRAVDDDVRAELEFHIRERAAELEEQGVPPEQSHAMARDSFGDRLAVEAECRRIESRRRTASRRATRMSELRQDLKTGWRMLARRPAFTLAALLVLGLGTGGNAAVFSVVNQVLLRPLPYPESDRLMKIVERHENGWGNVPWATFLDLRALSQSFEAMSSYGIGTATVLVGGKGVRVRAGANSLGFFQLLGTRPFMGRMPLPDEHRLGAPPVAVVSHAFWRDQLGAPATLENARVNYAGDHAVVGVLPPEFDFANGVQLWRPIELSEQSMSRTSHNWDVVARLRDGVSRETAERELNGILERLKEAHYPDWDAVGASVTRLQSVLTGPMRVPLYLLLGASGILLLAACANIAGALLARCAARQAEFSVRSALGASRGRLARQLLAESSVLAFMGAGCGLILAAALLELLKLLAPATLRLDDVSIDGWVLGFAVLIALASTVLIGVFPAVRSSDSGPMQVFRGGARGVLGVRRMRLWNALVAAEIALAIVLLSGSTLLMKSFARVADLDLGFEPADVLAVSVDLPGPDQFARMHDDHGASAVGAEVTQFHDRLLERLDAVPGISRAGFVNVPPLQGNFPNGAMIVEGKPLDPRGEFTGSSVYRVVGGGYFDAMRIPVVEGEVFRADNPLPPNSVVVNVAFATREWPNESAVGKRVMVAGMDGIEEPWYTVVGVVGNVRGAGVTDPFRATYFFDHRERPWYRSQSVTYVIRSSLSAAALAPLVRSEIAAIDARVAIETRTLSRMWSSALADRRFTLVTIGVFSVIALLLAAAGVFTVVSFAMTQRRPEIGLRIALGATPARVHLLVLRDALLAIVPGVLVGVVLALTATRALSGLLYQVSPSDAASLATAALLLAITAVGSSLWPALQAGRLQPQAVMQE